MNDEISRARLYLSLDADEMANVCAEHRKWEAQRKTAIAYGDTGSPVEPIFFAPLPDCLVCGKPVTHSMARGMSDVTHRNCLERCVGCRDSLTHDNRYGIKGLCLHCLTINNARAAKMQEERAQAKDAKINNWILTALAVGTILLGTFVLCWKMGWLA